MFYSFVQCLKHKHLIFLTPHGLLSDNDPPKHQGRLFATAMFAPRKTEFNHPPAHVFTDHAVTATLWNVAVTISNV